MVQFVMIASNRLGKTDLVRRDLLAISRIELHELLILLRAYYNCNSFVFMIDVSKGSIRIAAMIHRRPCGHSQHRWAGKRKSGELRRSAENPLWAGRFPKAAVLPILQTSENSKIH